MYRSYIKINPPGEVEVATLKEFSNVGKTKACYDFQDCDVEFLQPPLHSYICLRVSFSGAAIIL